MLLFSILTETTPEKYQNYHLTQIEEINEVFRNEKITPNIVKLYLDGIEMIRKEYVFECIYYKLNSIFKRNTI